MLSKNLVIPCFLRQFRNVYKNLPIRYCSTVGEVVDEKFNAKPVILGQPTSETHPHLINDGEIGPGIQREEYRKRRENLMNNIHEYVSRYNPNTSPSPHLIIIPSAVKQYMSDKIPYVFRQNSDFYYLTGSLEPDSCLIMYVNGDARKTTLFVRPKDKQSEMWDGPRTGTENAVDLFGIDEALSNSDLEPFINSHLKPSKNIFVWHDFLNPIQIEVSKTVKTALSKLVNRRWESPIPFVHRLRVIKSPAEIALMEKTCEIASEAFIETMKHSKPGCSEHELFARVDFESRMRGAEYLAYPPVVAGGPRANTIHYVNNNQIVNDGEMVLMDAGCEYHGYTSDITRTWPVNGKFSAEQQILYEIILDIQKQLIKLCVELPSIDQLFDEMSTMLGQRLGEAHIISNRLSSEDKTKMAFKFCPHHVSHYLGMDVHDTPSVSRKEKLQPGMVITMEPGIYIPEHFDVPEQFRGIGIRIEDDILITESGPQVLSKKCPKDIAEINKVVNAQH